MNLQYYVTTALEDWVTDKYINAGILKPSDIDIKCISKCLGIDITPTNMPSRYDILDNGYVSINLNKNNSLEVQKEEFFHETCHVLRHDGQQTMMPKAFQELQEWDAKLFTMYAALPYHMIKEYNLNSSDIVKTLSTDFGVSELLCKRRLQKIKNNITYYQSSQIVEGGDYYVIANKSMM